MKKQIEIDDNLSIVLIVAILCICAALMVNSFMQAVIENTHMQATQTADYYHR